jgi:hypothetical protein
MGRVGIAPAPSTCDDDIVLEPAAPVAPRQSGPSVWRAVDVANPREWTWELDDREIDAMLAAGRRRAGGDPAEAAPDALDAGIARLASELLHGRGFRLIRGFPVDDVDPDTAAAAFVALGRRLGSARSQNAAGDLLGHVRNVGADAADPSVRIYQTNRRQTFHTDSCDVVGLMCMETAASGGASMLVSAGAVYNEMLDRDAELAALLFEPVATDRRDEVPPGADPWFEIPVLSWHAGHLTVLYQRQYIESARRFADAPPLTDRMVAALDLFDAIADDPAMHLTMDFQRGDIQFVYNHALLHDREAFTDKPGAPRHLLRLWLAMPGDRELPEVFAQRYGSVAVGDRGGITVE